MNQRRVWLLGSVLIISVAITAGYLFPVEPEPPPPPPPAPPPAATVLTLEDGSSVEGELLRQSPAHVVLRLPSGEVRSFPRSALGQVKLGHPQEGSPCRIALTNGKEVEGELLKEHALGWDIRLEGGTIVTFKAEDVAEVSPRDP